MVNINLVAAVILAAVPCSVTAFQIASLSRAITSPNPNLCRASQLFAEEAATIEPTPAEDEASSGITIDPTDDELFDKAEKLGKGSAKAKRGKRKGGSAATADVKPKKAAATLAPEEVFYEGPPAITETIVPTVSILTVVGIIPAAAAWARQAWVCYKITTRRIRVTSDINGRDMAEIVWPIIIEFER